MPCPDKNSGARNPFLYIVFMQLQCWSLYTKLTVFRDRTCFLGCSFLGPMKALHNATPMEIPQSCCYLISIGNRLSYFHGGKEVLWELHKLCVESSHKNSTYVYTHHNWLLWLQASFNFIVFFKMVVSYFPSNVRLCSLICSSSSSNVKRVIDTLRWSLLVLKPSWAKTFCVLTTMIKLKHPPPSLFSLSVIVHYAKSAGFLLYL